MQIPMVVRERTVRVQACIPASQGDALKALAAASGVPVSRAVHYAVERLLEVARRDGSVSVTTGLVPASPSETGGDSVAEVAEALDLRVPEPEPERAHSVGRNGVPVLALPAEPDAEPIREQPAEQGAEQPSQRTPEHGTEQGAGHGGGHAAVSPVEQDGDATLYSAADASA